MPYPSNIHIHHLNAYIYTAICNVNHDNAILIRLQISFSLIRAIWRQQSCNRAGECLRGGIIACVMDQQVIGGMPSRAVSLRGVQSSEGAQGRNTVCTLKRVQYQEGVQSTLTVDSLLYGTQTERGCWSQYTPGYQAEPITTDRYIIPLDSPIWRVRYIYRTWKYVNTFTYVTHSKCRVTQIDPIAKFYYTVIISEWQ